MPLDTMAYVDHFLGIENKCPDGIYLAVTYNLFAEMKMNTHHFE